jgi:hypothetical protein
MEEAISAGFGQQWLLIAESPSFTAGSLSIS